MARPKGTGQEERHYPLVNITQVSGAECEGGRRREAICQEGVARARRRPYQVKRTGGKKKPVFHFLMCEISVTVSQTRIVDSLPGCPRPR